MFVNNPLVQQLCDLFSKHDFNVADGIFASHFVAHVPLMPLLDRFGYKSFVQSFYAAFPDFRQEIHNMVVTQDWIVIQVTYHGTQHGDFLGIPSTDCVITLPCILMFRIEDDLIVENWTEMDIFGVVNQISTARQLCPNPQLSAN